MDNQIVIVDMDDYTAIYVGGKLNFYDDTYSATVKYGIELGQKYPNYEIVKKAVDWDWFDDVGQDMPEDIEEVIFR